MFEGISFQANTKISISFNFSNFQLFLTSSSYSFWVLLREKKFKNFLHRYSSGTQAAVLEYVY